jgi:hypothetical protein
MPPVDDALVRVRAFKKVGPLTVRAVVEAACRDVVPVTVRVEKVVLRTERGFHEVPL